MKRYDLNQPQINAFVDLVMHHMTQEMRLVLMRELPAVYNKVVGAAVVEVRRIDDASKLL